MECNPFIIVYAVLQLIAFLLVLVGTALDMFRSRQTSAFNETSCLLLWGLKRDCYSIVYASLSDDLWALCPTRRTHFFIARIFAIVTIAVYFTATVLGFLRLCFYAHLRWVCLVLNILGFVTLSIPLALMVVSYKTDEDLACPQLKRDFDLGIGFFLFAAALGLDLLNIIVLLFPCQHENVEPSDHSNKGSDHSNEGSDHSNEGDNHSKEGNSQEE